MFTSPRALVRGYGWRDTVSHEFVHYYVTKLSSNTVPIWLHEGIAKFEEARWRSEPGSPVEGLGLDPPQENLLARSLKADKLITFKQMHPSMAKLPSQQAAGLAFAQVHTVIGWLHEQKGYPALRGLLRELRGGAKMDTALRATYGYDLDGLWTRWKTALRAKGLREFPGLVQTSLQFKRPGDGDQEPEVDYSSIEEKRVKDHTHLGELLRARERYGAAWKEYRRAMVLGGEGNPVIQNGAAASLIELGRAVEVPELLGVVASYYPGFLTTHLNLGEAYVALGLDKEAVASFEAAVGINPFHPRPHAALVELYPKVGRDDDVARAKKALEILR
jgi:tetratricopeptide (TPR) repeat protein